MPQEKTAIPKTILRSDERAQEIWKKAHDNAIETYGEGERAHRVAYAARKREYEKKGDRWAKNGQSEPADPSRRRADAGKRAGSRPR